MMFPRSPGVQDRESARGFARVVEKYWDQVGPRGRRRLRWYLVYRQINADLLPACESQTRRSSVGPCFYKGDAGTVEVNAGDHSAVPKGGLWYWLRCWQSLRTGDEDGAMAALRAGWRDAWATRLTDPEVTYRAAVDEVAYTGRVVCIGYAGKEVSFATKLFVQKELDILGSRNATADDFRAVIAYLEQGTFPLEKMITKRIKSEEAAGEVGRWAGDPGKVMKILLDFSSL